MKSIIALALLVALAMPAMALSSLEQAYMNGVNDGLKLGKLAGSVEDYNSAVQEFNDLLNQTFGANASSMWLPVMADNDTVTPDSLSSVKPVHKMDGTPSQVSVIQY
jgi:hypothetical protein